MHYILLLLLALLTTQPLSGNIRSKKDSHSILVSVLPQKYIADHITQGTIQTIVIVPSGASPHSYEPTLKQVLATENADVWFRIGEVFELKIIKSIGRKIPVIDQREGIDLLSGCCGCHREEYDTHIWLSPRILEKMTDQMVTTLSSLFPENADLYRQNGERLIYEFQQLDKILTDQMASKHKRYMLVSHPAFGYFCRDYNLHQVSIESEGRDPSPQEIANLLTLAKREQIKHVLVQAQYHPKRAETLAKEIGATSSMYDPYAENVLDNLKYLGNILSEHE